MQKPRNKSISSTHSGVFIEEGRALGGWRWRNTQWAEASGPSCVEFQEIDHLQINRRALPLIVAVRIVAPDTAGYNAAAQHMSTYALHARRRIISLVKLFRLLH